MGELPTCHSRRTLPSEPGALFCVHPRHRFPGNLVSPEVCRVCTLWKQPPPQNYKDLVSPREPKPEPSRSPAGTCRYLGTQVGLRLCRSCCGTVRVKVFACEHPDHRETTLKECQVCADQAPGGVAAKC